MEEDLTGFIFSVGQFYFTAQKTVGKTGSKQSHGEDFILAARQGAAAISAMHPPCRAKGFQ